MTLFAWPENAAFSRVVSKSKIYEHVAVSSALKERFVQQVEQISWAYKLAPETINLPATSNVTEIQVFRIILKRAQLDHDVLEAIDRAIPFPLIFELVRGDRIKLIAAYKRPAMNPQVKVDNNRWVTGSYFETNWQPENSPRQPLPVVLDMAGLYEQLLHPLIEGGIAAATMDTPVTVLRASDRASPAYTDISEVEPSVRLTLEQRIGLAEAITAQQKVIERIKTRLNREKQFNKRVAINTELRDAKQKLQQLTQKQTTPLID